jgi:hypothetical protein
VVSYLPTDNLHRHVIVRVRVNENHAPSPPVGLGRACRDSEPPQIKDQRTSRSLLFSTPETDPMPTSQDAATLLALIVVISQRWRRGKASPSSSPPTSPAPRPRKVRIWT